MSSAPVRLSAIPLSRVVDGQRVRMNVAFDLRDPNLSLNLEAATVWFDTGWAAPNTELVLREPTSGIPYGAAARQTVRGRRIGIKLNAAALADLRNASGAFFTVEGEVLGTDAPTNYAVAPRVRHLTFRSAHSSVRLAA